MSALPTLVVKDRRIDFGLEKESVVLVGGKHVNYTNQQFQGSTSAVAGGSLSVTIPDSQALLRTSYLHYTANVQIYGTPVTSGATTIFSQPGVIGLNSNPLWKIISSVQLTLGNFPNTTSNISQTIDLQTLIRKSQYVDWTLYGAAASTADNERVLYGPLNLTAKNVLGYWYNGSLGDALNSRTSRLTCTAQSTNTGSAPGTANFLIDIVQPLNCISPFCANNDPRQAFVKPGSITFTINSSASAEQLFSIAPIAGSIKNDGSATFTLMGSSALEWVYATIDISDQLATLPPQVYSAFKWDYNTQMATLMGTAGQVANITVSQVVFSTQPELIIVCVRPQFTSRTAFIPNYYFPIVGCNINYNISNVLNISGSMGANNTPSAQVFQLYQLCVKNGLNMDFDTWSARNVSGAYVPKILAAPVAPLSGGFIVLSPLDIGGSTDPSCSAGTSSFGAGLNFSGTLQVFCPEDVNMTVDVVILRYCPQEYYDQGGGSYIQRDLRPNLQNVKMLKDPYINYNIVNNSDITGGGFFDHIRSLAKKGLEYAVNNPDKILDAAKFAHSQAKSLLGRRGGRMIEDEDVEDVIDRNSSSMRSRLKNF